MAEGAPGSADGPRTPAQPTDADIRTQLERIVASPALASSPQQTALLRFIVGETLASRHERLKAYTIGLEVYHRPASFDPQTDSIVRVEASRLRRRLQQYYLSEGRADPLVIELPPGSYVPRFSLAARSEEAARAPEPEPLPLPAEERPPRLWFAAGLVGLGLGLLALVLLLWGLWEWPELPSAVQELRPTAATERRYPTVAVARFRTPAGDAEDAYFSSGMTEEIIARLTRFRSLRVLKVPPDKEIQATGGVDPAAARAVGAHYAVEGSIRRDQKKVWVSVRVVDVESGRYVWAASYERPLEVGNLIEIEDEIARQIAAAIGEPYGVLSRIEMENLPRFRAQNLGTYECILWALHYWANISQENHRRGRECLEKAVKREPEYAVAWAYLSYFYIDEYRWHFNYRPEPPPMIRANDAARRAIALDPDSAVARLALSAVAFFSGDLALFRAYGEKALKLNPNNGEHLASFGARLAYSGDWAEGIAMVREAIVLNPWHPDWYLMPLAFDAYRQEDYAQARAEWKRLHLPELYWTHVLGVMINGQLGHTAEAAAARASLLALFPDYAQTAVRDFQVWNFADPLIDAFIDGLAKGGVRVPDGRR